MTRVVCAVGLSVWHSLCCVVLLLSGCARPAGPVATADRTVPVSGTLTFAGKPLEGFQVTFLSADGHRAAIGVTDSAGRFVLGTNEAGDGAPPGRHRVSVVWVGPQVEMVPGQEEIMDDPSLLPKPSIEIPQRYGNPETSGLVQEVPENGLDDVKIELNKEASES